MALSPHDNTATTQQQQQQKQHDEHNNLVLLLILVHDPTRLSEWVVQVDVLAARAAALAAVPAAAAPVAAATATAVLEVKPGRAPEQRYGQHGRDQLQRKQQPGGQENRHTKLSFRQSAHS